LLTIYFLIGTKANKIATMAKDVFEKCARRGLGANKINTKYMSNNPETEIRISGTLIEKVEKYISLSGVGNFSYKGL